MAARIRAAPTIPARTGPAAATARRSSAISTAPVAATPPGTPLTRRAAAASRTWSAPGAPASSIASLRINQWGHGSQALVRLRQSALAQGTLITPQTFHVHVNHRRDVERQKLRNHQPADYRQSQRLARVAPFAVT